jgi:UPF0271 protein
MTATRVISLNTDIGEGFGSWQIADDSALLRVVTDANLACGFHASDPDIMRRTCDVAAERGITVGAQVGYHDLRGFGRRFIEVDPTSITNDVLYQLGALSAFVTAAGSKMGYLKIHGALYHAAVARADYADAVIRAIALYDLDLPMMCQPGTSLFAAAKSVGLRTIAEGYIDRAYTAEGLLVPRDVAGSVVTDRDECVRRALQLALENRVEAIDGTVIDVTADSLCIHSDSAGAPELARAVRDALEGAGVVVEALGHPSRAGA